MDLQTKVSFTDLKDILEKFKLDFKPVSQAK